MQSGGYILPDCLIIGAQKCGTSALWHTLSQHSHVGHSRPKEKRFFSAHYGKGLQFYSDMFRDPAKFHLDATPQYLRGPNVPVRVKDTIPHVKLVVSFRDPVERAYSQYYHVKTAYETPGNENTFPTFGEVTKAEIERTGRSYQILRNGHYAAQLAYWLECFDISQFFFIDWDNFYQDNVKVYRELQLFLGLPAEDIKPVGRFTEKAPMEDSVRAYLQDYYRPHDDDLANLLGRRFSWMDRQGETLPISPEHRAHRNQSPAAHAKFLRKAARKARQRQQKLEKIDNGN